MRKIFLFVMATAMYVSHAQNVGIGTKNPQNKLHIAGGLRIDSIANKKDSGLILHNNLGDVYSLKLTGKKADVLRGDGTFAAAAAVTDAWLLGGNAGTDSNTNFLGTTDNRPLIMRVNNQPFGFFGSSIRLGYGSKPLPFGYENVLIGNNIMSGDPTSASYNIAIGSKTLNFNATGNNNVAIGYSALQYGSNASVAIGNEAMSQVSGQRNTAVGALTMTGQFDPDLAFSGNGNSAFGASAMVSFRNGNNNTAIGTEALAKLDKSEGNTAIGFRSLFSFIGYPPGQSSSFGNVALGAYSLYSSIYGAGNTAIGFQALLSEKIRSGLTAVGSFALEANAGGCCNTAIGTSSIRENTTGEGLTGIGHSSLTSNTTGSFNTATGYEVMYYNTTGHGNTADGWRALMRNTTGLNNTGIGKEALFYNTTGRHNVATGFNALYWNSSGIFNTAAGTSSLFKNTTGNYNVSSGSQSLFGNTIGSYNAASGFKALFTNTTGSNNTASGFKALNFNTTGSNNTADGWQALNGNTTGSYNTAVGVSADVTAGNLTNATAIGYNAKVNASNKIRIGNAAVTKIEGQVPFTTPSDGRYKFNVKEDVKGLEFIMILRPVTYQFDVRKFDQASFVSNSDDGYEEAASIRRTGFIAQEVEAAAISSNYNFSGIDKPGSAQDHYSLSYESFVVPLVKAVQELNTNQDKIIKSQEKNIRQLKIMMEVMDKKIEKQQQMIDQLINDLL